MPPRKEDMKSLCFLELFVGGFHLLSHLFLVWRVLSAEWAAAFPLPGSHPPSRGVRQFYLPKTPPRDPGRPQGLGHAWAQPGDSSCKAVNLGFKTHLFVCLSLGNREDGKNVNVILSPMSHHSARAEMPRSCHHKHGETRKGLRHPKSSSLQLSACLALL